MRVVNTIAAIPATAWDACAGPGNPPDNPFVCHGFLNALEDSGAAATATGWHPMHLIAEDGTGAPAGVVPLYLKNHSYGEYVFDWAWADAYERAGGRYYPKLQACIPFTPVTGPRLLIRPDVERKAVTAALIAGLEEIARRLDVSSLHVTFAHRDQWEVLGAAGFLQRLGIQYHFENPGYRDFDDFLAALTARRRKTIRKERRAAAQSGLRIRALSGAAIRPHHWDAFHRCYVATADRKWGQPYLTRSFFHRLGETMAERVLLVVAEDADGRLVAGALNLIGGDTLYGRNWGCLGDYPFLHFELCYYRAIEFAIARGLKRIEAGAQGDHKILRGYRPVLTYSAHWIADPGFRDAVARYLDQERPAIEAEIAALAAHTPYRHEQGKG